MRSQAEHEAKLERETEESLETGHAEWEVRVEFETRDDIDRVAEELEGEGIPVVRRSQYLLLGAVNEDEAKALSDRLRASLPAGGDGARAAGRRDGLGSHAEQSVRHSRRPRRLGTPTAPEAPPAASRPADRLGCSCETDALHEQRSRLLLGAEPLSGRDPIPALPPVHPAAAPLHALQRRETGSPMQVETTGTLAPVLRRSPLLRPLANRDFALLFGGMTVSLVGDGIYTVAIAWQVYQLSMRRLRSRWSALRGRSLSSSSCCSAESCPTGSIAGGSCCSRCRARRRGGRDGSPVGRRGARAVARGRDRRRLRRGRGVLRPGLRGDRP